MFNEYNFKSIDKRLKEKELLINNKDFKEKLKEGFNYPIYPNHLHGKNLLLNIRSYLIGKEKNRKNPKYPPYIIMKIKIL